MIVGSLVNPRYVIRALLKFCLPHLLSSRSVFIIFLSIATGTVGSKTSHILFSYQLTLRSVFQSELMTCTKFQFCGFFVLPSLTLTNVFDDRTGTPSSGLRRQADLCRRYHPDSRCRSHCPISTVGVNYEGMIIPRYVQYLLSCREYIRLSMWSFQWWLHFLRLGQTLNCIIWVFEMNNWAVA